MDEPDAVGLKKCVASISAFPCGSGSSGLYSVSTKCTHGKEMGKSLLKSPSLFLGIGFGSVFFDQGSYGIVFDMMLVTIGLYTFILNP